MQLMAEEMGLKLDREGFEACMEEQRQRSRAAGKAGGGPTLKFEAEATAHLANSGVPVTDDSPKCPDFSQIYGLKTNLCRVGAEVWKSSNMLPSNQRCQVTPVTASCIHMHRCGWQRLISREDRQLGLHT